MKMNNIVENIRFFNSSNKKDDNFVGLKFFKDNISIYFPIGYNMDNFVNISKSSQLSVETIKEIDYLLNTISIAKSLSQSSSEFGMLLRI